MKTLIRNILLLAMMTQMSLSAAQAALVPMKEKLNFAKVALRDHLEPQGLQLVKVDIKAPEKSSSMIDWALGVVGANKSDKNLEYVRFAAIDVSTERVYKGWVYLKSRDVSHLSAAEIDQGSSGHRAFTQVIEQSGRAKIWLFLADGPDAEGPLTRFGDHDLHLTESTQP